MKISYFKFLTLIITLVLFNSCADTEPLPSSDNLITSFSIMGITGSVNPINKTVSSMVDGNTFTNLVPTITVSASATISPESGIAQDFTNPVDYTVTAEDGTVAVYTVTIESSIIPFSYNGTNYEIVRSNKTWSEAASFAISRAGRLAEINDLAEQNALFSELTTASIVTSKTTASDGGNASYLWIGGNDMGTEGNWMWDGNNDQNGTQFWMGTQTGTAVGGLYNNWGDEPDDFGSGQDGLALALNDWPLGVAGQWNDLELTNTLYFLIELD
jgi:hypothetical protein